MCQCKPELYLYIFKGFWNYYSHTTYFFYREFPQFWGVSPANTLQTNCIHYSLNQHTTLHIKRTHGIAQKVHSSFFDYIPPVASIRSILYLFVIILFTACFSPSFFWVPFRHRLRDSTFLHFLQDCIAPIFCSIHSKSAFLCLHYVPDCKFLNPSLLVTVDIFWRWYISSCFRHAYRYTTYMLLIVHT